MSRADRGPDWKPRRHPGNAFRPVADEGGLVVVPRRSVVEVLNPVGSKIFSLLDGQHTLDAIVREVVAEFEVAEPEARRHLEEFLQDMEARDMLAVEEPCGAAVERTDE